MFIQNFFAFITHDMGFGANRRPDFSLSRETGAAQSQFPFGFVCCTRCTKFIMTNIFNILALSVALQLLNKRFDY
jgi:hypothetical protein